MKDLPDQLFRHFGLKAIPLVVLGGFLVWGLAHWSAAPGHNVSVLWGLVQYTKSTPSGAGQQNSIPMHTVSSVGESEKVKFLKGNREGKIEVVAHGYSKTSWSQGSSELRKLRGLRELSALESGKPLISMPSGTFGFMDYFSLTVARSLIISESDLSSDFLKVTVHRFESKISGGKEFEIHCDRQADKFLLGFTTETTASAITSSKGIKEVVISAQPGEDLRSLVLIDINLLKSWNSRYIESGSGEIDFVLDIALW